LSGSADHAKLRATQDMPSSVVKKTAIQNEMGESVLFTLRKSNEALPRTASHIARTIITRPTARVSGLASPRRGGLRRMRPATNAKAMDCKPLLRVLSTITNLLPLCDIRLSRDSEDDDQIAHAVIARSDDKSLVSASRKNTRFA